MSNWLLYLSILSPLVVIAFGWRQKYSLLWFYAAVGLSIDSLGMLFKYFEINNHVIGNLFVLAELLFVAFYYRKFIFSNKNIFYIMTSIFAIGFVAHTLYTTIYELNYIGAGILCALYIGFGISGYLRMLKTPNVTYLNNSPFFWVNTGFFLYASSSCLLFLFATYLRSESFALMFSVWGSFFTVINILRYILIAIGLYKTPLREA